MSPPLTEITVVGEDKTGLIARVTTLLFERDVNIEDLDQAVRDGLFRMTMRVDATGLTTSREELDRELSALGDELGLDIRVRFPADRETKRIAVLVTKESHCLSALLDAWADGGLEGDVEVVIGNHDDLEPLADRYGVPFHDVGDDKGTPDEDRLLDLLDSYDVDLIVLARYMRILGPNVVFRYENRIINIHPSLLPSFPGAKAYRQAKEKGVRIAGVTAHYVTTDLDQGPIITQRAFNLPDAVFEADSPEREVVSDDELMEEITAKGQPLEADALLEAVRLHLDGAISVHRGRTELRTRDGDHQLGLPAVVDGANPERPIDGRRIDDAASTVEPTGDE